MTPGRPKTHVCVHAVRLTDGRTMTQVFYRGTRAHCEILADDEPPVIVVPAHLVAEENWWVKSAREWSEMEAGAEREGRA